MNTINTEKFLFENKYVYFDATKFPYLYIRYKPYNPTKSEYNEYMDCMDRALLQKKEYVLLLEMKDSEYLSAEHRKTSKEWSDKNYEHLSKYCKATANLVRDEEQKNLLQHVMKEYNTAYPNFITESREKAEEWLEGRV